MKDLFVQSSHGRIHLLTAGRGTPMLLLHSNGSSAYEYEHVIKPLAESHEVFAWDMPGQGDSDPLLRHISVRQYADAVIETMDQLGLAKVIVAGASIGGAICVALGAHYPDRFTRIFVVECPFRTLAEWKGNWANTEANYAPVTQAHEKVAPRLRSVTPEVLLRWNIDRAKAGSKTCLSVMWALREYDMAADLERFPAHQVLVFGDKSPTVANKSKFDGILIGARTHVIENCGHFPMIDDPERFVTILRTEA